LSRAAELIHAASEPGAVQREGRADLPRPVLGSVFEGPEPAHRLGLAIVGLELGPVDRPVCQVPGTQGHVLGPELAVDRNVPDVRRSADLALPRAHETVVRRALVVAVVQLLDRMRRAELPAFEKHDGATRGAERERGGDAGRAGADDAHLRGPQGRRQIAHARSPSDGQSGPPGERAPGRGGERGRCYHPNGAFVSMPAKLLILGIDAASPTLLRRWANEGQLPAIRDLME